MSATLMPTDVPPDASACGLWVAFLTLPPSQIRGLVRSLMTQDAEGMAGYLMRIEASAPQLLPNTAMDRFVVQFVSALGKCFAQATSSLCPRAPCGARR